MGEIMKDEQTETRINDVKNQDYLSTNWLTSEVLIGMYSRIFTNVLLSDDKIFKRPSK
jgi:hypothetical protein